MFKELGGKGINLFFQETFIQNQRGEVWLDIAKNTKSCDKRGSLRERFHYEVAGPVYFRRLGDVHSGSNRDTGAHECDICYTAMFT